jgi:hypothetical protein
LRLSGDTENTREPHRWVYGEARRALLSLPPALTRRGSNGEGFSMDTRLLGPKWMNGLKILSSTRLLVQTNLPTTHQRSCRRRLTQLGSSHTLTLRANPPSEQQVHSKVSFRRAVDAVQRWSGVFEPASGFGEAHDVQAACEPGGGGRGGVPVHSPRLHTHRTSPAQALLTTLFEASPPSPTFDLLSHCPRRVYGVRCALADR